MGYFKRSLVFIVCAALAGSAYALVDPGLLSADGGFPFPALPEPSDWMTLLCGLAVAGFIARRKTSEGLG